MVNDHKHWSTFKKQEVVSLPYNTQAIEAHLLFSSSSSHSRTTTSTLPSTAAVSVRPMSIKSQEDGVKPHCPFASVTRS